MNEIRRSNERGYADHGWLKSFHTLLVCRLLRSRARRVRAAARHQRGPRAAGAGFRHPRPPGHGDHQLRARRRAGAQGLDGQRLDHPPGRRAAHERRHAACATASSILRAATPVHFLQIWIQPNVQGIEPSYEEKRFAARGEARPPAPDRLARSRGRLGADPPGRARVRRPVRRRGERDAGRRSRAADLRARGARAAHARTASQLEAGDALKLTDATSLTSDEGQAPKCWCSTCRGAAAARAASAECHRACGPRRRTRPTTRGHSSGAGSYGTAAARRRSGRGRC